MFVSTMAFQSTPKMSLVAQFDDLCRYSKVLTSGPEEEFKTFVEGQLNCYRKWKESESEVEHLNQKVSDLKLRNGRLETQIKLLKDLLQDAANRKRKVEAERNSLERQILLIKEVLLADGVMDNQTKEKLGFLSSCKPSLNSLTRLETIEETAGSLLSLSDIDRTEEDLDSDKPIPSSRPRRSREKRRSNSDSRISQKKKKIEIVDDEHVSDETDENVPRRTLTVRCNSEPASSSPEVPTISHPTYKSDSANINSIPYDFRRCSTVISSGGGTPVGRYSTNGKLSRQHVFVLKILYRPEKCNPCRHNIGFFNQAFKCQDCAVICHPECKDKCPLPCIPTVHTPVEGTTGTIADYTSSAAPMIPPLIVHCVNEIESRGLGEKGLYRVSASDREVKLLRDKFLNGRSIPLLYKHDINAICSTVKEFLRSLSEPLITRNAWQEFAHAAGLADSSQSLQAMYDIVSSLPQPNRDTLAFLVLHLQRVAESTECKMPISNLARIFGPTIMGYSVPDPAEINVIRETEDQYKVMERLLSISSNLWQNLLNVDIDDNAGGVIKTPENLPAPKGTRLGPLLPPGQKAMSVTSRTPLSGRNSRYKKSGRMSFSSPVMK